MVLSYGWGCEILAMRRSGVGADEGQHERRGGQSAKRLWLKLLLAASPYSQKSSTTLARRHISPHIKRQVCNLGPSKRLLLNPDHRGRVSSTCVPTRAPNLAAHHGQGPVRRRQVGQGEARLDPALLLHGRRKSAGALSLSRARRRTRRATPQTAAHRRQPPPSLHPPPRSSSTCLCAGQCTAPWPAPSLPP